ncbi:MAG: MOSC domain-containing protein [Chloroflexota bacterium]
MQLRAIHFGKIQTHHHNGNEWQSAYKKLPVDGTVHVGKLNVEGDEQFHTKFHGGEHRAVLMYSAEHYERWSAELDEQLPYGSFAENFTVSGLDEDTVCIGDVYQIGDSVRVQVAQPRQPCNQIYKALGIRGIVNKIKMTYRSGWYCRVLQEGSVQAGMTITLLERLHPDWTIIRAHQTMTNRKDDPESAHVLAMIEELEPNWRKKLSRA